MEGEITGSRLQELAVRALRHRGHDWKPHWRNDVFYIVHINGQYLKKVRAARLGFHSKFHRYFDNYFYAWACFQRMKDEHYEETDSA